MLMYLFKENKFVFNIDVINLDIEKRTYKEMAERFGVSKKIHVFIFVGSNIYPKMLLS
jgi:hypothetical protein